MIPKYVYNSEVTVSLANLCCFLEPNNLLHFLTTYTTHLVLNLWHGSWVRILELFSFAF